MDENWASDFARESWALYGVGVATIVLRYVSRIRKFGIRNLRWDDYIMFNGLIWYTMLCVALNQIASGGGSNLISADELKALTPEGMAERIKGSKWVFVSEHSMMLCIWSMKACMLILYASLTDGVREQRYFNWLGGFIAAGFVASELTLFLACRPIQQYWAVPPDNPQCFNYAHYEIVQACFNIPGDIAMLLISIPLIIRLQITVQQKAILLLIFGMGGFVIVASILTKIYCLVPDLISYIYMNWYFREASVTVYVTNLPTVWPLVREVSKRLGLSMSSHSNSQGYGSKTFRSQGRQLDSKSQNGGGSRSVEMRSFNRSRIHHVRGTNGGSESQEYINGYSTSEQPSIDVDPMHIKREVTYTVESVPVHDFDGKEWPIGAGGSVVAGNGHPKNSTNVMNSRTRDKEM